MTSTIDLAPHLATLSRYAFVLTRDADQAEDLVQEVLIRALEGAHTWQADRELRPWLLAIAHNTHISRQRRRKVEESTAAQLSAMATASFPAGQLSHVELSETMTALMRLPDEQREILVLVAVEGLSYREVAQILGIPLGTLMSRLGRARQALRSMTQGKSSAPAARPTLRVVK